VVVDCLILGLIGGTFTALGCLKLYGLARGVEGGRGKTFSQKLCGT